MQGAAHSDTGWGAAGRAGESRQDLAPGSGGGDELEVHRSGSYSRIWHVAK